LLFSKTSLRVIDSDVLIISILTINLLSEVFCMLNAVSQSTGMRVALYTEGTYPQAHGGVSVWADQLVQGMPEHEFQVVAITGLRFGSPAVKLPGHARLTQIPLWGEEIRPVRRSGGWIRKQAIESGYESLLEALLTLNLPLFRLALHSLSRLGMAGSLTPGLASAHSAQLTLERWQQAARLPRAPHEARLPAPTVADALDVHMWLEHALRPLASLPPEAQLGHAVSNGFSALAALHGLWRRGTPFLLTEHGVYLRERYLEFRSSPATPPYKTLLLRFHRLLCSLAYQEAALILPGSHYNRRWEERMGAAPEKIVPIYNGIDPDIFPPAQNEPEGPVVSWVGRIDPLKDLETLIRAFSMVRHRMPAAQLRLFGGVPVGNEGYFQQCQRLVSTLRLEQSVTFEGRVPDITDAYRAGQVVALSSVSEGFPYTVIESMAMGRPPVVTRVGGVPEAIGETGFVVSPRDTMAFSNALLKLLGDAPLRQKLGQAARERVLSLFTLEGCLDAYRLTYPSVANGGLL
jgi:polysaccharide biosynthesis protein PelF